MEKLGINHALLGIGVLYIEVVLSFKVIYSAATLTGVT